MPYKNVPKNQWGKMDRCVEQVMKRGKGMERPRAIAVCYSSVVGKEQTDLTEEEQSILKEIDLETKNGMMGDMMGGMDPEEMVPLGITSFQELKAWRDSQDRAHTVECATEDLVGLTKSVLADPTIPQKGQAIVSLAREFASIVDQEMNVPEAVDTSLYGPDQSETDSEDGGGAEMEMEIDNAMITMELDEKAVWTTAYVNNLPDSSFLYVEPGDKDGEGKTVPRSNRHLPYKDASGKLDLPHLRNAIARVPQMKGVSAAKKSALQDRARRLLANASKENADILTKIKGLLGFDTQPKEDHEGLMIWKEAGSDQYQWLARYSNNFRDDDNPPEIISEKSHQRFVEMVDKGDAPLPQLWLWHIPEWKIGQATALAYDDAGFAVATGYFDKGKEHIAEWLSKQNDVLVSHGMPTWSIKRDEKDPSIIVEHQTAEISPLPGWAAANKITGFVVLDATKEEEQMIPDQKKRTLIEQWKIAPSVLEALERQNVADAQKAASEGRESKENDTEQETTASAEETKTEAAIQEAPVAEKPVEDVPMQSYPTREEIADAFGTVLGEMRGQIDVLANAVVELTKELNTIKKTDEEKIVNAVKDVPAASLSALLSRSIVGQSEAVVDGRSSLGKDKPKETQAPSDNRYGIPFIQRMVDGAKEQA